MSGEFVLSDEERAIFDHLSTTRQQTAERNLAIAHCISHPAVLLGWKVKIPALGEGVIVDVLPHFGRSTSFMIDFPNHRKPMELVLNRKGRPTGSKYIDFTLVSKEF